jgi:hypothetical protein
MFLVNRSAPRVVMVVERPLRCEREAAVVRMAVVLPDVLTVCEMMVRMIVLQDLFVMVGMFAL